MIYPDELFVVLLKKMLCGCKKLFNLVIDSMSAHKKAVVKTYVANGWRNHTPFSSRLCSQSESGQVVWSYASHSGRD